jgi:Leucine-rich repeat (LRR) protein
VVGRGPWKITFGDCEFTGNTDGAPLVRTGSCPDAEGALDLQYRNITVVPATAFQGMGKMTKLYLDVNLLSALPEGIFAGLASLNELGLQCNQLTTLKAGVFDGLSSLWVLNLSINQLTALSSGVFAGLSSLT